MPGIEVRREDTPFKISLDKDPVAQEQIFSDNPGDVPVTISPEKLNIPIKSSPEEIEKFLNLTNPKLLERAEEENKRVGLVKKGYRNWTIIIGTVAAIGAATVYLINRKRENADK